MPLPRRGVAPHVGGGNETHSHLRRARQPTRKPQVKTRRQIGVKYTNHIT